MAHGVDGMTAGKVIRKRIYLAVGMSVTAASITLAYLAMQDLMDVGGFCASGGPYEIRQECPDTSWLMFVAFPAGFVGVGFLFAAYIPRGPRFLLLVWSALFIALGVNFLVYGFDPPPPATGLAWGWLICAVVFLPMGGIPLAGMLLHPRKYFWDGGAPPTSDADQLAGILRTVSATMAAADTTAWSSRGSGIVIDLRGDDVTSSPAPPPPAPDRGDISDSLLRLADLHERGLLSDDEFAAAKSQLLSEGPPS